MIGIVGAGITGLVLAHQLRKRGVEHRVFEAATRPGGVVATVEKEGRLLELGPQRFRLTPSLGALVDELGLKEELLFAPAGLPLYVYSGGRLRRVPPSFLETFTTDLISWPGKLRILAEPATRGLAREGSETLADFLTRKFGREAYRKLLGPLLGGLYASDPGEMPARRVLPQTLSAMGAKRSLVAAFLRMGRRKGRVPACSFRGGMGALPRALYEAGRDRIHLGAPVVRIGREGRGPFSLELSTRETASASPLPANRRVAVDHLVITTPARECARLLREVAPAAADRLARLRYNPLALVHLAGECPLEGFGYQVAFGEELRTRGVTWNASLFGRKRGFTAFLGGMKDPAIVGESDETIAGIASEEFHFVTGREVRALQVHRTSIPAWDRTWEALDGLTLPKGVHIRSNYLSRPGLPGRVQDAERLARQLPEAR